MQCVELAFTMYEQYYYYAAALLGVTVVSCFTAVRLAYVKRMQLYASISQRQVVPIVQRGYVRY